MENDKLNTLDIEEDVIRNPQTKKRGRPKKVAEVTHPIKEPQTETASKVIELLEKMTKSLDTIHLQNSIIIEMLKVDKNFDMYKELHEKGKISSYTPDNDTGIDYEQEMESMRKERELAEANGIIVTPLPPVKHKKSLRDTFAILKQSSLQQAEEE